MTNGQVFEVPYPFVRDTYESWASAEGPTSMATWKPGPRFEDFGEGDVEAYADAMGTMIVTVVSTHKPASKYPMRVFYVRQWRDPDGKVFGKPKLRVVVQSAFDTMVRGYRHRFEIAVAVGIGGLGSHEA